MNILVVLLGAAGLFAALYVYLDSSRDPGHGRSLAGVKIMLVAVGLLFGGVFASIAAGSPGEVVLIFTLGFGLVHIPAAVILFFKRTRRDGPPPR